MSKSKKIALTSVAMVTAGLTTASNLTFTTQASANSHRKKSVSKKSIKTFMANNTGYSYSSAKQTLKNMKPTSNSLAKRDKKDKANQRKADRLWNKGISKARQAGQKAYNQAIRKGKDKDTAQLIAQNKVGDVASNYANSHYGHSLTGGAFSRKANANIEFKYRKTSSSSHTKHNSGVKKSNGTKKNSDSNKGTTHKKGTVANQHVVKTPAPTDSDGIQVRNYTTHKRSNGRRSNTTPKQTTNANKGTTTTGTTNVFKPQTVKGATVNKGTKLSKSIKSLDSKNKSQEKAVKALFGSNKTAVKTGKINLASISKSAGKLAGAGLKASGKGTVTAKADKGKISLNATGKGTAKTASAEDNAGEATTSTPAPETTETTGTTATDNGTSATDSATNAQGTTGTDSTTTTAGDTTGANAGSITATDANSNSNATAGDAQATGTTSTDSTTAQTGLSQDINNLDQQSQAQGQQLDSLLNKQNGDQNATTGVTATASASSDQGTTGATSSASADGTDTTATGSADATKSATSNTDDSTISTRDPAPNISPSAKAMNPISAIMSKSSAKPKAIEASTSSKASQASSATKASNASSSSSKASDVKASSADSSASTADADASVSSAPNAKTGATSKGNVATDAVTDSGSNGGIKSSSADADSSSSANADSASAGSDGTATLPQTGNSSNKAGIVAGSAMVMAMAGLGLSAKVVKQRKDA